MVTLNGDKILDQQSNVLDRCTGCAAALLQTGDQTHDTADDSRGEAA